MNLKANIDQILILRQRELGLMSIIGFKKGNIVAIEMIGFFIDSIISFIVSFFITALLLEGLKIYFSFDLLTCNVKYYLIIDFILTMFIFLGITSIELKSYIRKISNRKIYREVL